MPHDQTTQALIERTHQATQALIEHQDTRALIERQHDDLVTYLRDMDRRHTEILGALAKRS